jgi:sugar phosphate isomerase/epimerase
MKDMFTHEEPFFTTDGVTDFAPVGEGVIDFDRSLPLRETAGMKYMIVEQDSTKDGMPFDAIQKSITNLTTRILA